MGTWTPPLFPRLETHSQRNAVRPLTDMSEESSRDKKEEDVPEEVTPAKHFMVRKLSEIFHGIKNAKNKVLEADPNFERRINILQGVENMLTPHPKTDSKKKADTAQATLDKFFYQEIKHFEFSMFLLFQITVC